MPFGFDYEATTGPASPIGPAEHLVLEACRDLARRADRPTQDRRRWHVMMNDGTPGGRDRGALLRALEALVNALGMCATCPLHGSETSAGLPNRGETLVLGLVSALQHGDDDAANLCLRALTCPGRCAPVAMAAATVAMVLKGTGRMLLPVSAGALGATAACPPQDDERSVH